MTRNLVGAIWYLGLHGLLGGDHGKRFEGITNAFSKKAENHAHMMAIYFMHYNFVRIHQTLKITLPWLLASRKSFGKCLIW